MVMCFRAILKFYVPPDLKDVVGVRLLCNHIMLLNRGEFEKFHSKYQKAEFSHLRK